MKVGGQAYQMLQDRPLDAKIQAPTRQQIPCRLLKKEAQIVTSIISPISNTKQVKVVVFLHHVTHCFKYSLNQKPLSLTTTHHSQCSGQSSVAQRSFFERMPYAT